MKSATLKNRGATLTLCPVKLQPVRQMGADRPKQSMSAKPETAGAATPGT
jgi:hypothetical protein